VQSGTRWRIRDGRATVSGEPLEVTAGNGGKAASTRRDPRVRILGRTRKQPPREKGRYLQLTRFSFRRALRSARFASSSRPFRPFPRAAESAVPAPSPEPSSSAVPALRPIGNVVTSDRKSEPIGLTSQPTFVIDRSHIESFGDRTVADALQDVPGVEIAPYGAFGAETNYGIRGATSAQTLVLVDGIPVTDPTTGAVQLSQFSTAGVQRIEIVESGSSTLYGTSASGGVINIITQVPRGAYLAAAQGSFGDRDLQGVRTATASPDFRSSGASRRTIIPTARSPTDRGSDLSRRRAFRCVGRREFGAAVNSTCPSPRLPRSRARRRVGSRRRLSGQLAIRHPNRFAAHLDRFAARRTRTRERRFDVDDYACGFEDAPRVRRSRRQRRRERRRHRPHSDLGARRVHVRRASTASPVSISRGRAACSRFL
jgi:outer membrane receptor protein involved in Fe transport